MNLSLTLFWKWTLIKDFLPPHISEWWMVVDLIFAKPSCFNQASQISVEKKTFIIVHWGHCRDKNIMINVGKSRGGFYVNGCGGAVHSKGVHFISIWHISRHIKGALWILDVKQPFLTFQVSNVFQIFQIVHHALVSRGFPQPTKYREDAGMFEDV